MTPLSLARTSLLVIDAQRGFTELCPAELPVPGGAAIVPAVNRLLELPWARVDASQDWHPPDHSSFLGRRLNLYPPHCVQGTAGADFIPGLRSERFHAIWRKGMHIDADGYSLPAAHPGFAAMLHAVGIDSAVLCGLTTNICVFHAARDLRKEGFRVLIAEDAAAGIDVPAAGLFQSKAKEQGERLGVEYVKVKEVLKFAV